jgi:ectoine hydroxylase-related dioxygenase (phytanoyl-CoA dioxygenase family)
MSDFLTPEEAQQLRQYAKDKDILSMKKYIVQSGTAKRRIRELLGDKYVFHDYIFLINKSQFHTCHRDYNGDFFNEGQKHPSYTLLIYLNEMNPCLEVIPKTHRTKDSNLLNLSDYTESLTCSPRDAILFNANLIHSGSINENENNPRIQMKISHVDDLEVLKFYSKYNKILNSENNTSKPVKYIQKHISCQFPILSQLIKDYDFNKDADNPINKHSKTVASGFFSAAFSMLEDVQDTSAG